MNVRPEERAAFLTQTEPCLVPGYTGHCPSLRFRVGKRYGASTKDIIQELKTKGVSLRLQPYRQDDPISKEILKPIQREKGQMQDFALDLKNRVRPYILGYTGYIPGMQFRYGASFARAADASAADFNVQQQRLRLDAESRHRDLQMALLAPERKPYHAPSEVRRAMDRFYDSYVKYPDPPVSESCPPMTGYTGHIPRVRGESAALGRSYGAAARHGLQRLREDRQRRHATHDVQRALRDAAPADPAAAPAAAAASRAHAH
ncbi:hypothetical protein R5R35_006749 [Gryllus longicercus]|uniref:Ciliary microtubule inner protein 2A-C-like domain-containing protein n=1 Tax=Gryllus longicercus TaxID=2509291 RepID=A0AAN9WPC1_9ORTH